MLLEVGVQERLIAEAPSAAGTTAKEISVQSDTVLVTLWVQSVAADLTVNVWAFTDDARTRKVLLFSFPVISAPSVNLLLRRASITTSRVFVEAVYTGACDYEIHIRAVEAGLSDSRILGANGLRMSQVDVTSAVPVLLVPVSLVDRAGIVFKNWSSSGTIYVGASTLQATTALGYPLGPKDAVAMDVAAGVTIYGRADAGTVDVRVAEAGG